MLCSFFGRIEDTMNCFRDLLNFTVILTPCNSFVGQWALQSEHSFLISSLLSRLAKKKIVAECIKAFFIVSFRFDARDKSLLTYASHFSPIYGQRASMRLPNGMTSSKVPFINFVSSKKKEKCYFPSCDPILKSYSVKHGLSIITSNVHQIFSVMKTYVNTGVSREMMFQK